MQTKRTNVCNNKSEISKPYNYQKYFFLFHENHAVQLFSVNISNT